MKPIKFSGMTEEKPTIEKVLDWLNKKMRRDARWLNILRASSGRSSPEEPSVVEDIAMCEAIRAIISRPPAPNVVTREQVQKWILKFTRAKDGNEVAESMESFLADLGYVVEKEG